MNTSLSPLPSMDLSAELADLAGKTREYIEAAKSSNTKKAYSLDWQDFMNFCQPRGFVALPATPEAVALYLTWMTETGKKASTIQRRLVSISQAHKTAGYISPTAHPAVRSVWQGIKRTIGTAQVGKAALMIEDLKLIVSRLGGDLASLRTKALLLIGWAAATRSAELAALTVEDIEISSAGLVLTIRRSKTDQAGAGRRVAVPTAEHAETDPALALRRYLDAADIKSGAIFRGVSRSGRVLARGLNKQSIGLILKSVIRKATGLAASAYSSHSMRAGFVTTALKTKPEHVVQKHTGHKSTAILRRYAREARLFVENACEGIGL